MEARLRKLLQKSFHRYLLVGGSVYVFEILIILMSQGLGASPVVAVAISFCLGTIVSFWLQKLVTFSDKRMHHKVLTAQFVATGLLVAFNFLFTLLVVKLLAAYLPAVLSRTIALAITTSWNFFLYKTRIFKSDNVPVY